MKKTLLFTMMLTSAFAFAQQMRVPSQMKNGTVRHGITPALQTSNEVRTNNTNVGLEKSVSVVCTDKVKYVGSTDGASWQVGGFNGWDGAFEVFPNFTGQVTAVDFRAAKISNNYTVAVKIFALSGGMPTGAGSAAASATVNNTTTSNYTVTFGTPITVTNGFVVAVMAVNLSDSVLIEASPNGGVNGGNYDDYSLVSYGTNYYGLLNDLVQFGGNNYDEHFLFSPTIKFNSMTNTLTASPTSACINSSIYFSESPGTNGGNYYSNIYNPMGVTDLLDYGDGNTVASTSGSHSYTTPGTKTAQYTMTYLGWTTNCISAPATTTVTINPGSVASFTWSSVNLAASFVSTSTNTLTQSWLFGDGGSSGAPSPVHNYVTGGTYTVELTTTGTCGNGYYTTNIHVDTASSPGTGIAETGKVSSVIIYPNPANMSVAVNYDIINTKENATIDIVNALGQIVKSVNIGSSTIGVMNIDLAGVAPGTYYIKIQNGDKFITRPFVRE